MQSGFGTIASLRRRGKTVFRQRPTRIFHTKVSHPSRLGKKTQGLNGARRELNQLEVYHANLAALDHYRRLPLNGALTAVEIFHTARLGRRKERDPVNWNTFWSGTIVQHGVPGKNSGDMLAGVTQKFLPLCSPSVCLSLWEQLGKPGRATDKPHKRH